MADDDPFNYITEQDALGEAHCLNQNGWVYIMSGLGFHQRSSKDLSVMDNEDDVVIRHAEPDITALDGLRHLISHLLCK